MQFDGEPEVYNPHGKPTEDLPVIYGFNNGGRPGWFSAALIAEDGTGLGGHLCSHEVFMPGDLGVFKGSRADRHEGFREHYPDGYRMEFVGYADVRNHPGLNAAIDRANAAQGIETRRAETGTGSVVDESPTPIGDAL